MGKVGCEGCQAAPTIFRGEVESHPSQEVVEASSTEQTFPKIISGASPSESEGEGALESGKAEPKSEESPTAMDSEVPVQGEEKDSSSEKVRITWGNSSRPNSGPYVTLRSS